LKNEKDIRDYNPEPLANPFENLDSNIFENDVSKLKNLSDLKKLYEKISPCILQGFENLNAILVVGGTGAGKSTFINSLQYGPGVLRKDEDGKILLKDSFKEK